MTAARTLPQWKCHKIVGAFQISTMQHHADGTADLHSEDGQSVVTVSGHFLGKNEPRVGGYFVQYSDGYTSYSPKKAFEDGYTRLDQTTQRDQGAQSKPDASNLPFPAFAPAKRD